MDNPMQRIFSWGAGIPEGVSWHTASQAFWRSRAEGKYVSDVVQGAHAPASCIRVSPNGVVDCISLDPNGTEWVDLGGKGGVDFKAGRY